MIVNATGPVPARILIVGEAPGEQEAARGKPFVGASGALLDRLLGEAGISRFDCRITNVFRERPIDNEIGRFLTFAKTKSAGWAPTRGAWVIPTRFADLLELEAEVARTEPNVIIALGGTPLWFFTGKANILAQRGNISSVTIGGHTCKLVPSFHPAYIMRQWKERGVLAHDLRTAAAESLRGPRLVERPESFIIRPTLDIVRGYFWHLFNRHLDKEPTKLAADIETRGGHIACIGFAHDKECAICIPLMSIEHTHYWSLEEELEIVQNLRKVFTHPNLRLIGQNFSYDAQYLYKYWRVRPPLHADTMFMQHTLFCTMRKALDFLVTLYADQPRYWKVDGKEWDPRMPEDQLWEYNARDCSYTFEVYETMLGLLHKTRLTEQWQFLQSLYEPVQDMMIRGLRVDLARRRAYDKELEEALVERTAKLERVIGHPLQPNSSQQLQRFFYDDLKMKKVFNRKTDKATVDDDALDKLEKRQPVVKPIIRIIKDARSIRIFRSTFINAQLSDDSRLRCHFNIAGTKTYRFSSSENAFGSGGNMQNIPRNTNKLAEYVKERGPTPISQLKAKDVEEAEKAEAVLVRNGLVYYRYVLPSVRKMFIPDEGYTMVDMDLDRADAQVVAWEANDEILKQMFHEGVDIHAENAKVIGMSRQMAKVFVHGTNYLGRPRTMAEHCGITVHQAEIGQRRWFAAHPGIREWHARVAHDVNTKRMVYNKFGFRCPILDRPEAYLPEAVAWIASSTVSIVINKALLAIYHNLPEVQLLLQVHDSLLSQVLTLLVAETLPKMRQHSLITVPYDDPLVIPVGFKTSEKSWGECETVDV